ncbi:hypothetical protein [Nocardiopsis composta]|uniref:Uncharacterized protein n=1 Tax=Nocardiopsis composta TaxID=157465 RepID=A0A7W8VCI3_9ACTN|nr:hypothetical protein [Nocardiopsis composta]MBB5431456.1 hypothetical protein [Nocardiopsis composta]
MAEHAPESEEEAPAPEAEREGSERAEREPTERPDDGAAASGEEPKAANSAADNYGQLVQDAVIYGGMHIHTGAGDGPYTGAEATRLVRAARRLDPRRVEAVRASFVRPEHYPHFEREFRDSRVGVIVGPSGAGRAVTAVYALDRTGLPLREAVPEAGERDLGLGRLPAEPRHAYLLDLTPFGDVTADRSAVREYARRVRAGGGRLIVIAEAWKEDPADAYAHLAVEPASAERVFHGHLRHLIGREEAERWSADPEIRELLGGQTPARAVRMAKQVQRSAFSGASFELQVKEVLEVFRNYAAEVREWFQEHEKAAARAEERRYELRTAGAGGSRPERREELRPSDYQRVLIEAVAVLEGCPSDAVLLQVDELAKAWSVPVQFSSPISGGGLTAMLAEVGSVVDAEDRIRFRRTGFGDVVLDHLWHEYPKARRSLLTWSNRAVREVPARERREVAQRWLRLAERQDDPGPVNGLLVAWGRDRVLRPAAVPVVAQAAVHGRLGPAVRAYLYRLAEGGRGGVATDIAVAQVCGQYGRVEPGSALVRLRLIADRAPDSESTGAAVAAALDSIAEEAAPCTEVLRELAAWTDDAEERGRAGFARGHLSRMLSATGGRGLPLLLVRTAAEPAGIPAEAVGCALAAALGGADPAGAERILAGWDGALGSASRRPEQTALETVLLAAAAANPAANVRIARHLRRLAHGPGGRRAAELAERAAARDSFTRNPETVGGET